MDEEVKTNLALGMTKWVHALYYAGAFLIAWLGLKIVESIWTTLNLTVVWVPPPSTAISVVIGGGMAIGLGIYLWKNPKVNRLAVEIVNELAKVSWPNRKELYASTVVVIVLSVVASIILWMFDFFWAWITDLIYM